MLTQLVERGSDLVPRHLGPLDPPPPPLLTGCVRGDAIDPGPEGGCAQEGIDLASRCPERVLHDLLRIRAIARDADRQPVDAIAVGGHECLGGSLFSPAEALHQARVRIVGAARRRGVHIALEIAPRHHGFDGAHFTHPRGDAGPGTLAA